MRESKQIRARLLSHPLYTALATAGRVRTFMEHHVFAVWDFMSLLKRMQRELTCVELPWVPRGERPHRRLINEIVLAEESDEDGRGGHAGHFEIYLEAMREAGASTTSVERMLASLKDGMTVGDALRMAEVPASAAAFVKETMAVVQRGATHEVCAAFFFGREDVIPGMFNALLGELAERGMPFGRLRYYLERHIQLDGDHHALMAHRLLDELCAGNPVRIEQAEQAACMALKARVAMWDGVVEAFR